MPVAAAIFDDPMEVPPLMGVCQQQDFGLVGVELVSTLLTKLCHWAGRNSGFVGLEKGENVSTLLQGALQVCLPRAVWY